jgi:uncharacterized membrane protein
LKTSRIRRTALFQALTPNPLAVVILAATVNLITGLST